VAEFEEERRAGAFWIVKSSVMIGATPRAVDKLQVRRIHGDSTID
jgi:hypothetical protein